jgi:hypothetical protein
MSLSPVQAAHRAAHRARLEVESRRAANALSDVGRLVERRGMCREFLKSKREAITVLEDEAFAQLVQIVDIQRRLCELGYTGD